MGHPIDRTQAAPWLKDELWRKARAVPSLDLRFADNKSLVDAVSGQNLITFTRASSATFIDSTGALQTAATDEPRFDHNPTTGESLGLLVEEQRTNLLLDSATLATQSVTVAAVAHTLSFYGTGTVTLSGTSTAGPAVGSGAFPTRTTLTFTPTAGSLTLTVSGSVTSAQLEAGAFPTSYIPTTTAAATRAADVATITGSNFSRWYRQDEETVYVEHFANQIPSAVQVFGINNGTATDRSLSPYINGRNYVFDIVTSGVSQASIATQGNSIPLLTTSKGAFAASNSGASVSANGLTAVTDASVTLPTTSTEMQIGRYVPTGAFLSSTIRRLIYFPARLPDTTLQRLTQ
jgi:hypothetical protein